MKTEIKETDQTLEELLGIQIDNELIKFNLLIQLSFHYSS